jgi:hypothetical protein
MKLTISRLREIVRRSIKEARAEGAAQAANKKKMKKRIATASTGGNENTPPYTKKAATAGKSGLGPF